MDQTPQVQQPQVQLPEVPKKKNNFLFVEMGLFEIGFVVVLLVFIFGLLNYMNILNLSKAFPMLSFLPTLQSKNTPPSSEIPQNIIKGDNKDVKVFIAQHLKSSYIPFFLKKNDNVATVTKTQVQFSWRFHTSTHSANMQADTKIIYSPNSSAKQIMALRITTLIASSAAVLNPDSAQQILSTYLQGLFTSNNPLICNKNSCEIFKSSQTQKEGYGIVIPPSSQSVEVFYCSIFNNFPLFPSANSCVPYLTF